MKKYNISVSSLAFGGQKFYNLANLPADIGVEIFCEWASDEFWAESLPVVMKDRQGEFSVHAPFDKIDISSDMASDEEVIQYMTKPFELYHKYNAQSYVIHTNDTLPNTISEAELTQRKKTAERRVLLLNEIAEKNNVTMLVENLGWGVEGKSLYKEKEFLDLFDRNPQLKCLIDVGHANVEHFDIENVQRTLGDKIKAYHIHNNDGFHDSHKHITNGTIDYKKFFENSQKYTPNAAYILEYGSGDDPKTDYMETVEDINLIKDWLK